MGKLLGIIILVLSLVLFPPAALAVVSNNAVPGDATYPIKRGLEDVIFAVASLSPTTKAWFAAARSSRRFQEVTVLIAQGKKASNTLNELVEQTQIAASQIDQVKDPAQKEKLISQLSESIAKYDAGLSQISAREQNTAVVPIQPAPTRISSVVTPQPAAEAAALPISQHTTVPQSSGTPISPTPTTIATPEPTVAPTPSPTPAPSQGGQSDIDKARDELDKIKKKLEERQGSAHSQGLEERSEGRKGDQEKRDENSSRRGRGKEN